MKRRIPLNYRRDEEVVQEVVDHKEVMLKAIIDPLPDIMTIGHLAKVIGFSYEWVRVRIMATPERLSKFGSRYRVSKGVAAEFIRANCV